MRHLTCGINSLLHSVNLILFTLLLVHVILRMSLHHSSHVRFHNQSLLNLSLTGLSGHWRSFWVFFLGLYF